MKLFLRKSTPATGAAQSTAPQGTAPAMVTAPTLSPVGSAPAFAPAGSAAGGQTLAALALQVIHDGVIITDPAGTVQFANPAAATMLGHATPDDLLGLDSRLFIKLQSRDGHELAPTENAFLEALRTGQPLERYQAVLVAGQPPKDLPVAISVLSMGGASGSHLITLRDITKELAEESEQAEFVSTASHEMRTPVATIDGYISLALNPQTATIDERARGYLNSAHQASQHLGKLFQDLLDVTKLDDGRLRPHLVPVEVVSTVKQIADDCLARAGTAKVSYRFGATDTAPSTDRRLEQLLYASVDLDFLREIVDNLLENAIKYTPEGGTVTVNVRGENGRIIISVADTGIGISAEDLQHVFQKFYRADNSDTREIGGTGLGLYLVKQRVEALGGRVWAESAFGAGSTFLVSLPAISSAEYEKRMIAINNQNMIQ